MFVLHQFFYFALAASTLFYSDALAFRIQQCVHEPLKPRKASNTTAQLESLLSAYSLPSLAVSAHDNDQGLHQAHTGVRQISTTNAISADDTWHLGSNTKAMTATTLAPLIQEGVLAWDTTLLEVFPTLPYNLSVHPRLASATISDLAAHRSGITGTFGIDNPPMLPAQMLPIYEMDGKMGRAVTGASVLAIEPMGQSGKYEYSNNNYIILGLVIDAVTQESAENVIQERLWDPSEMKSAVWGTDLDEEVSKPWPHLTNTTQGETYAYKSEWPTELRDYASYANTAGRARMNLADYDKWLRLHVDEEVQRTVGLDEEQLEILHTAYGGEGALYSRGGWIVVEDDCAGFQEGGVCLSHSGSNTMNYASAWVDTGMKTTYAAASNAPYERGLGVETAVILMLNGTMVP